MYTSYERDDLMIMRESKCVRFKTVYKVIIPSLGQSGRNALFTSVYPHRNANLPRFKKRCTPFFSHLFLFTYAYDPVSMQIVSGSRNKSLYIHYVNRALDAFPCVFVKIFRQFLLFMKDDLSRFDNHVVLPFVTSLRNINGNVKHTT